MSNFELAEVPEKNREMTEFPLRVVRDSIALGYLPRNESGQKWSLFQERIKRIPFI